MDRHAGPRLVAYAAAVLFAAVIAYFLWAKAAGLAWAPRPVPPPPPPPPPPEGTSLPTKAIRMKIKRVEPRKYRREGETPPPAARR